MYNLYYTDNSFGPTKVVTNLKKGFDIAGIDYECNTGFDKVICLQNHQILMQANDNMVVGPNVCVLPPDNHYILQQKYHKCIVPSQWVKDKYSEWINADKIFVWPAGIDTDYWKPANMEKKYDCLVYYKRRHEKELHIVKDMLDKAKQSYFILSYGSYKEEFFYRLINESSYGILLDSTESQGIAMMEMMSCNLPLFVWNKIVWDDRKGYSFPASSVPYFDNKCGCIINEPDNINECFKEFLNVIGMYKPRE